MKTYYEIIGYDGTKEIYRTRIPTGCITPANLMAALQTLAAMHGLTADEAVRSLTKRRTKLYLPLLAVAGSVDDTSRRSTWTCGENPYFVAYAVEDR